MEAIFTIFDPVLRGPFFTCVFVGMFGGLLGVWLFFQKQLLIGEVLSHSIFPGMIVGALFFSFLDTPKVDFETLSIFIGGGLTAYLGICCMRLLVEKKFATQDGALSCTLSVTFGMGLFGISLAQTEYPSLWRQLTGLLMGQAATISSQFIPVSYTFCILVFGFCLIYRRGFFAYLFDRQFAQLHRLMRPGIERVTTIAIIIASILGVRLMGVVLLSAMFTFPPVIARLFSDRAPIVAAYSTICGGAACGLGVLFSHFVSTRMETNAGKPLWLPTGPIVVLLMALFFLIALVAAPTHGLFMKLVRRLLFQWRCTKENILKFLWKRCVKKDSNFIGWEEIRAHSPLAFNTFLGRLHYYALVAGGYMTRGDLGVVVSERTLFEGRKLVRLHRLWELYLVEYCGMDRASVHPSAEEMEHILTRDMEEELTLLLNNPSLDPHKQPIPGYQDPFSSEGQK